MLVPIFLWGFLFLVGVPLLLSALGMYSYRISMAELEVFREAELDIVPVDRVRSVPKKTLKRFAESLRSIGFRELLGYTKEALAERGNFNYCWVFVAPDGLTLAEAEYVRINWYERILYLIGGGRRYLPSLCGITLVSAFDGHQKFITTDLKQMKDAAEPGCQDVCLIPKGLPLSEAYSRHCAERDKFLATRRGSLRQFQNTDDFVQFERSHRRYLTSKAEQELEDAWGETFGM
jgi:hypothetical protein